MIPQYVLYNMFLILELMVAASLAGYTVSMVFSHLMGSPFVTTRAKVLHDILKEAHLKKGMTFVELGSGDGRVVRTAVKHYQVKGIGIDINPSLTLYARVHAKLQKLSHIVFKTENIFKTDLSHADVVYLFLLPNLIEKLKIKFENELKDGVLVISHGFKIHGWEKMLEKDLPRNDFSTYFYRFKRVYLTKN
jgi:hypothetical protein